MKITEGRLVELDYILKVADGEVVESSAEEGPIVYLHGNGEIPERLENALLDSEAGAKLELTLEPKEAFGEYDVEAITTVPREDFPADAEIEKDQWIQVEVQMEGEEVAGEEVEGEFEMDMRVVEINDESVVLDANHPLAGKTITYSVEVRDVHQPTEEQLKERYAGHEHGEDCCGQHDHA